MATITSAPVAVTHGKIERGSAFSGTSSIRGMASPMSRSLFLGSFSRHRSSSGRTFAGTPLRSGFSFTTDARISAMSSPWNGLFPVSISHSTTPKAQMSERLSTTFPRACSGDMYDAVPRIIPARVGEMVMVGEVVGEPWGSPAAASDVFAHRSPAPLRCRPA